MLRNRSIPNSTVIPELAYPDIGAAIAWLSDAFGFTLRVRIADHRAQMNVGDGAVVLTEARGTRPDADETADRTQGVMVRVGDVDMQYERAVRHGARVIHPPTTYPYGERQCSLFDPGGHRWTFSQSVADTAPEDWGGTSGVL
jgi:uncharacterized glyoxalase superfamily protein PhnB